MKTEIPLYKKTYQIQAGQSYSVMETHEEQECQRKTSNLSSLLRFSGSTKNYKKILFFLKYRRGKSSQIVKFWSYDFSDSEPVKCDINCINTTTESTLKGYMPAGHHKGHMHSCKMGETN